MSAGKADTWVTLERVDVDRCASAWLIKRFIDEDPKFVFFEQGKEGEAPDGIGYDYFGAKYFHKGSDCTFTALIKAYGLSGNKALQKMNSDVNDVFSWRWRSGSFPVHFREHIAMLREVCEGDEAVYENLYATFDLLYWSYGGNFSFFSFNAERLTQTFSLRIMFPHLLATNAETGEQLFEETILSAPDSWLLDYEESLLFEGSLLPAFPEQSWLHLLSERRDKEVGFAQDAIHSIYGIRMQILQKRVLLGFRRQCFKSGYFRQVVDCEPCSFFGGADWLFDSKADVSPGQGNPLQTMAAYIDLNPVRAGLVEDSGLSFLWLC